VLYEHWDDSYSLGFASIDAEHKRLFEIVGEIKTAIESQPAPGAARGFLERLVDHGGDDLHAIFRDCSRCTEQQAIWLQEHRAEHSYLAHRARAFMAFNGDDECARLRDLHSFLSRWLTDHIQSNQQALRILPLHTGEVL